MYSLQNNFGDRLPRHRCSDTRGGNATYMVVKNKRGRMTPMQTWKFIVDGAQLRHMGLQNFIKILIKKIINNKNGCFGLTVELTNLQFNIIHKLTVFRKFYNIIIFATAYNTSSTYIQIDNSCTKWESTTARYALARGIAMALAYLLMVLQL